MQKLFEYLKYTDEYHKNHLLTTKETSRLTRSILSGVNQLEATNTIPSIRDLLKKIKCDKPHDWIILALLNSFSDENGVRNDIPKQFNKELVDIETQPVTLDRFKLALKLLDRINKEFADIFQYFEPEKEIFFKIKLLAIFCLLWEGPQQWRTSKLEQPMKYIDIILTELKGGQERTTTTHDHDSQSDKLTSGQIGNIIFDRQFALPDFADGKSFWSKQWPSTETQSEGETLDPVALTEQLVSAIRLQRRINSKLPQLSQNEPADNKQTGLFVLLSAICLDDDSSNRQTANSDSNSNEMCDQILHTFNEVSYKYARVFGNLTECENCTDFYAIYNERQESYISPSPHLNLALNRAKNKSWKERMNVWREKTKNLGIAESLGEKR